MEKIAPFFPKAGKPWTARAALPGGDLPYDTVEARIAQLQRTYSFLKPQNIRRMFRAYGTNAEKILGEARFANDLGKFFGPLSEREINYLMTEEWACDADDILWRRSKLGLHLQPDEQAALRAQMAPAALAKAVKAKATKAKVAKRKKV